MSAPANGPGGPVLRETVPAGTLEVALAGLLGAIFLAGFLALPLLGAVGLPLAAVPLVRLAHRAGAWSGLWAAVLAAGLVGCLGLAAGGPAGGASGAACALLLGILPVLATGLVRRGRNPSSVFLWLCAAGFLIGNAALLLRSLAGGGSIGSELSALFDGMIPAALESYRRAKVDAETLARVEGTLIAARDFTSRYWAGLGGACWIFSAAVGFFAGARLARPAPSAEEVRFEKLRVSPSVAALFVSCGAAFAFLRGTARTVAGDLLIALAALYFVAGLSIICHFARRWFRVRVLRFGLYVLVAYFPMSVGVALLGLFDWYLNFRRRGEGAIET